MARKSKPFTPEFRRQMIELVRSGRSPESLAKGVRANRSDDPQLGRASGPRCRYARGWLDDGGSRRDQPTAA